MEIKKTAEDIWKEYQKNIEYKQSIDLYDNVKKASDFYHDKHWEGLNAPDLDKPVFNVLKPAVNYYVSMLVSDDIGVSLELMDDVEGDESQFYQNILSKVLENAMEMNKYKALSREFLKDCAIAGDCAMYFYFDPNAIGKNGKNGVIMCEIVDNVDLHFADVTKHSISDQPYIIVSSRRLLEEVKEEAKNNGFSDFENIESDDGESLTEADNIASTVAKYCTVLTKFYIETKTEEVIDDQTGVLQTKTKRTVKCIKTTKNHIIQSEIDLGISIYPVARMVWEKQKKSMHGVSPVVGKIPNQIFINKIYAMAMLYQKQNAFPKIFYDETKIPFFSNKIGQAIAVQGDPNQAVYSGWKAPELSAQVTQLADKTTEKTKDALGIYDAALGNVKPDNTSAIVAVQKSASQPLELQKMDYYQFVEDCVRILIEFVAEYYGERRIKIEEGDYQEISYFDFSQFKDLNMSLTVEVGAASYWDELTQVQTLDNLMTQNIIPDSLTYLEMVPDGYVKNKQKIIDRIKELEQKQSEESQEPIEPQEGGEYAM